jgi:hypothetical protein
MQTVHVNLLSMQLRTTVAALLTFQQLVADLISLLTLSPPLLELFLDKNRAAFSPRYLFVLSRRFILFLGEVLVEKLDESLVLSLIFAFAVAIVTVPSWRDRFSTEIDNLKYG